VLSKVIGWVVSALGRALASLGLELKRDADKHRAGRKAQELDNRTETDAAEKRMNAVQEASSDDVDQSLKDGKF
jgi:hypothetical protein